ncbi:MAG: hypothetical protein AB7W16_28450 [Candidatus Obscuribacterales bacterium]
MERALSLGGGLATDAMIVGLMHIKSQWVFELNDKELLELISMSLGDIGELKSQPATDWTGEIPLPDPIGELYRKVGPYEISVPTTGNDFYIPALSNLWELQAGYRWNSITQDRLDDWSDDWLVIASRGGDPVIISVNDLSVRYAWHGEGIWDFKLIVDDPTVFYACVAILGREFNKFPNRRTLPQDDYEQLEASLETAVVKSWSALLGSVYAARKLWEELG